MYLFFAFNFVGNKILHFKPYQSTIHKCSTHPQFRNKQSSNWIIGTNWVFTSDNFGNFPS